MKNISKILIASLLVLFGVLSNSHAQYLIQPLTVTLTAYDAVDGRTAVLGTRQLIRYLLGNDVPNARLYLVTPVANVPGQMWNLNAFLRIKSGTNTLAEINTPGQFNLITYVTKMREGPARITARSLNRFSITTPTVTAELQGFSTWSYLFRTVKDVDISGAGSFVSTVNGWLLIPEVMESPSPVTGVIIAGAPVPGP